MVDTVPKHQIGRAMGVITIFTGLAQVLSPVLGGLAYAKSGYISVFVMAFAFIGLDFILRFIMIEHRDALRWETASSTSPEVELQTVASEGNDLRNPKNDASTDQVQENAVSLPVAANSQPRRTSSIPALQLLGSPRFLAALWGICVLAALMTGFDSVKVPLWACPRCLLTQI